MLDSDEEYALKLEQQDIEQMVKQEQQQREGEEEEEIDEWTKRRTMLRQNQFLKILRSVRKQRKRITPEIIKEAKTNFKWFVSEPRGDEMTMEELEARYKKRLDERSDSSSSFETLEESSSLDTLEESDEKREKGKSRMSMSQNSDRKVTDSAKKDNACKEIKDANDKAKIQIFMNMNNPTDPPTPNVPVPKSPEKPATPGSHNPHPKNPTGKLRP